MEITPSIHFLSSGIGEIPLETNPRALRVLSYNPIVKIRVSYGIILLLCNMTCLFPLSISIIQALITLILFSSMSLLSSSLV